MRRGWRQFRTGQTQPIHPLELEGVLNSALEILENDPSLDLKALELPPTLSVGLHAEFFGHADDREVFAADLDHFVGARPDRVYASASSADRREFLGSGPVRIRC